MHPTVKKVFTSGGVVKDSAASVVLSVVVCTYNRPNLLREALASLAKQTLPSDQFEVLVVDNNSTDDSAAIAAGFCASVSNFHYVWEEQQGLSRARNRGLREALGRYIAYMDDDAKAGVDWCEKIVNAFENVQPEPVAVGGKILPWYEVNPPQWFSDDFEIRTRGEQSRFLAEDNGRDGFSGSNMAFPRDLLLSFKGFSLDFGMLGEHLRMGEETELFRRLWDRHPLFWYDPSIYVWHFVPENKLSINYRVKRSFSCGQSAALMDPASGTFKFRLNKLRDLVFVGLKLAPANIFKAKNNRLTVVVKTLETMAHLFGQFWAVGHKSAVSECDT